MPKNTNSRKNSTYRSSGSSYNFYNMGQKPLAYDVRCGSKVVIPAGTKNVRIAFGASSLKYWNEDRQRFVRMNVYMVYVPGSGWKLYHAC